MKPVTREEVEAIVHEAVDPVRADVVNLKTDVAVLKTDVAVLKTDVAVLKTDVAVLKTDVAVLKTDVAVLKTDMAEVKAELKERPTRAEFNDLLDKHFRAQDGRILTLFRETIEVLTQELERKRQGDRAENTKNFVEIYDRLDKLEAKTGGQ
jgi:phage shock protein A